MIRWGLSVVSVLALAACSSEPRPLPLLVIDTATADVVERWRVPDNTFDVADDDATGRVWIVAEADTPRVFEISSDGSGIERYRLNLVMGGGGSGPLGLGRDYWVDYGAIAIDPVHRRGSFTSPRSNTLAILDLDTGEFVRGQVSQFLPHGTAYDSAGDVGYGSAQFAYSFRASDGTALVDDLCGEFTAYALAFSDANQKLYATTGFNGICTYDPATNTPTRQAAVCNDAYFCDHAGIAVSGDGKRLYVSNPAYQTLGYLPSWSIWDLELGTQTDITDEAGPHGFAVSPDDSTLYVTETTCNRVRVFDAKTGVHRYDIPTDGETLGIDLNADGSRLYVTQVRADSELGGGRQLMADHVGPCPPLVLKP